MSISLLKKSYVAIALIVVGLVLTVMIGNFPVSAQDIENNLCAGANLDVNSNCNSGISDQDAAAKMNSLIGSIINIFTLVVGVVSVLMIIIGGFKYITSGGDSSNVSGAKNTILYAIIGLIIVALAQTIVRFVLGRVLAV